MITINSKKSRDIIKFRQAVDFAEIYIKAGARVTTACTWAINKPSFSDVDIVSLIICTDSRRKERLDKAGSN